MGLGGELPSSIEAIYIDKDLILAGDKEGNIVCWGSDGEPIWKQNVGNRVENFVLTKVLKMQIYS